MVLTCYYDLRYQSKNFDFAIFLAGANAHREQIKAIGLEIKIIYPDFEERANATNLYKENEELWKFQNIILKLPALWIPLNSIFKIKDNISELEKLSKLACNVHDDI